tara:strand:+ start:90 stop:611 length:522 start_codon:yes stop_codon:yes gene_type:complete
MGNLTAAITLTSTDLFDDSNLSYNYSHVLTANAPCTEISRIATNDDVGYGAGILVPETTRDIHYVYIRHTGLQADDSADSDYAGSTNTTATHATDEPILIGNADMDLGTTDDTDRGFIQLNANEWCFFPLQPDDDNDGAGNAVDDGAKEIGGLGIKKGGTDEVVVEYALYKRG